MDIIYYYSDSCKCCKDYEDVVNRVATALKIKAQKRNINDGVVYNLRGVPTVQLFDDNGVILYESVGNLSFENIMREIGERIDG